MTLTVPSALAFALVIGAGCAGGGDEGRQETATGEDTAPPDGDGDGWTEEDGDCNDENAEVHPGAVDVAGNGVDEDCDGADSGAGPSFRDSDLTVLGGAPYGLAGSALGAGQDIDGDGVGDLVIGAPGGKDDAAPDGHVYVFHGPLTVTETVAADAVVVGEDAFDTTGYSLALFGDGDGDGVGDLAIGAPLQGDRVGQGGAVFVFRGPVEGEHGTSAAEASLWGDHLSGALGTSLTAVGDVDGDGLSDLAVGSPTVDQDAPSAGRVSLWFGPQDSSQADVVYVSDQPLDYAGQSIAAAGDVNADGWNDLLIGAPLSGEDGARSGKVWLVHGPLIEGGDLADLATSFLGEQPDDYAGASVSSAGDVDGDGADDILLGGHLAAEGGDRAGKAWLFLRPSAGTHNLAEADSTFVGDAFDLAGRTVAGGLEPWTLLVAAVGDPYFGPGDPGTVHLWEGTPLGSAPTRSITGVSNGEGAGTGIATGDVTGDGRPDLIVGAPNSSGGVDGGGAVYVAASGGALLPL